MELRHSIRFYVNDDKVELANVHPQQTVLEFLRLDRALKGTKEGCAEGDCGACTVLVGKLDRAGDLVYETINACIRFVVSLDGAHLVTIERLSAPDGSLHPVQRAMLDNHGSQCGFCTPGIVMSLYAQWLTTPRPSVGEVEQALQGNLCRCTGYASIVRAALSVSDNAQPSGDRIVVDHDAMREKLLLLRDGARVVTEVDGHRAILPATADDLAAVLDAPDAVVVAGATDVGLWVTKQLRPLPTLVFLSRIRDLSDVTVKDGVLTIGAGVTYSEARRVIAERIPTLGDLWLRIGGTQVRNAGTIGGNVANGSPIGDTPPALIALGAAITLRKGSARRTIALEDFFIAYGRQNRHPGEFLESVAIPLPAAGDLYAAYKVTKRFDDDVSSVLGAFRVRLDAGTVTEAMLAYGGMAGTPKRARAMEATLIGRPWSRETVAAAMTRCGEDFQPLTDWRASADYRLLVARNLLLRFWGETTGAGALQVRSLVDG